MNITYQEVEKGLFSARMLMFNYIKGIVEKAADKQITFNENALYIKANLNDQERDYQPLKLFYNKDNALCVECAAAKQYDIANIHSDNFNVEFEKYNKNKCIGQIVDLSADDLFLLAFMLKEFETMVSIQVDMTAPLDIDYELIND